MNSLPPSGGFLEGKKTASTKAEAVHFHAFTDL